MYWGQQLPWGQERKPPHNLKVILLATAAARISLGN